MPKTIMIIDDSATLRQVVGIALHKIGIMGDIACQTNLLALDAAIEAGRPGDHGKGFMRIRPGRIRGIRGTQNLLSK